MSMVPAVIDAAGGEGSPTGGPSRVPVALVDAALEDAARRKPHWVDPIVGRMVASGGVRTRRLRLDRLARVVMAGDPRVTDASDVWRMDWGRLDIPAAEQLDRAIAATWQTAATRNAHRDAVRAVVKAGWERGAFDADMRDRLLAAVRPERIPEDAGKAARGHIDDDDVTAAFTALAADPATTARRDAAVIAIMVGCGLRRSEVCSLDLEHLSGSHEMLVVAGKGGKVRDVPLPAGVRRAVDDWLTIRGDQPGPLLCAIAHTRDRTPTGRRLNPNTIRQIVQHRLSVDVASHDLRRTAVGNLLDSGADLAVVARIVGHSNPATTARYDRRGVRAAIAAMDRVNVPFVRQH